MSVRPPNSSFIQRQIVNFFKDQRNVSPRNQISFLEGLYNENSKFFDEVNYSTFLHRLASSKRRLRRRESIEVSPTTSELANDALTNLERRIREDQHSRVSNQVLSNSLWAVAALNENSKKLIDFEDFLSLTLQLVGISETGEEGEKEKRGNYGARDRKALESAEAGDLIQEEAPLALPHLPLRWFKAQEFANLIWAYTTLRIQSASDELHATKNAREWVRVLREVGRVMEAPKNPINSRHKNLGPVSVNISNLLWSIAQFQRAFGVTMNTFPKSTATCSSSVQLRAGGSEKEDYFSASFFEEQDPRILKFPVSELAIKNILENDGTVTFDLLNAQELSISLWALVQMGYPNIALLEKILEEFIDRLMNPDDRGHRKLRCDDIALVMRVMCMLRVPGRKTGELGGEEESRLHSWLVNSVILRGYLKLGGGPSLEAQKWASEMPVDQMCGVMRRMADRVMASRNHL